MIVWQIRYVLRKLLLRAFLLVHAKYLVLFEDEMEYVINYDKEGVFIDVGANVGSYLQAANHNKRFAQVIGIEPVPSLYNRLKRIFKSRVLMINGVISSDMGKETLYIPSFRGNSKFSRASLNRAQFEDNRTLDALEVNSFSLDSLRSKMAGKCSFVKIDVEGHELSVLEGARNIIDDDSPAFLIEIELDNYDNYDNFYRVFSIMFDHGYKCYVWKNGLHSVKPHEIETLAGTRIFNNWIFKIT